MSPSKAIPDTVGTSPSGPERRAGFARHFGLTLKPRIGWSTSAVQVAPEPRARHVRVASFFTDHLSAQQPWLALYALVGRGGLRVRSAAVSVRRDAVHRGALFR